MPVRCSLGACGLGASDLGGGYCLGFALARHVE